MFGMSWGEIHAVRCFLRLCIKYLILVVAVFLPHFNSKTKIYPEEIEHTKKYRP